MFKKAIGISIIVISLFSIGCASVPMASMDQDKMRKEFNNPAENVSGIYIYRDSSLGTALKKEVKIDGESVGKTAIKTYIYRDLEPGKHIISTQSEFGENEIELEMMGGKNYFVNQYIKMGVVAGGADVKAVDDEKGKKGVLKSKLAK